MYFIDLTGQRYGKLVVTSRNISKNKSIWWNCLCDCGNTHVVTTNSLRRSNCQSCGCNKRKTGAQNPTWKGYEEISASLIYDIKDGASIRNIEYDLTPKYLWDLFIQQDRKCILTGLPIQFEINTYNDNRVTRTASLDRIDASKGYMEGNVQWVHKIVNMAKQSMTNDEFLWLCFKIINFYGVNKNEKISIDDSSIINAVQSRLGGGLKQKGRRPSTINCGNS